MLLALQQGLTIPAAAVEQVEQEHQVHMTQILLVMVVLVLHLALAEVA